MVKCPECDFMLVDRGLQLGANIELYVTSRLSAKFDAQISAAINATYG